MGADERADPLAGREQRVRQHGAGAGRRAGAAHTSLALPRPEDGAALYYTVQYCYCTVLQVLGRTGRALLPSCHQEKQRTPATRHITSCEEVSNGD